jgi:hypothetical protein
MRRFVFLVVVLLAPACRKKEPVKEITADALRLRDYCLSLKVGDTTPEIPAWVPQQGSRPNDTTVQLMLGSKGTSTCHVTIDTVKNSISAVRYQPD